MTDTTTAATSAASAVTASTATTAPAAAPAELGFSHFIAQTDAVGQGLFVILVLMSLASWALIVTKGVGLYLRQKRSQAFLNFFWNATSLEAVQHEISTHGVSEPFSHLTSHAMHAQAHHARYGAAKLEEAGSAQEFLTRTIKKVLDEETMRMESGLTVLATIGATAPFVGLFGTVWGVYHALLAIGQTGAGTLDKVAGPVGEALIMTALGLAVAIPATFGYNALLRGNKSIIARLNKFGFELHALFVTGARADAALAASEQAPAMRLRTRGAA